jgi:hypothetical protein
MKRTGFLRVVGNSNGSHDYGNNTIGEIQKVKAIGATLADDSDQQISRVAADRDFFPASLHFETYPGDGVVPFTGDYIKVTIERATDEEMREMSPGFIPSVK